MLPHNNVINRNVTRSPLGSHIDDKVQENVLYVTQTLTLFGILITKRGLKGEIIRREKGNDEGLKESLKRRFGEKGEEPKREESKNNI